VKNQSDLPFRAGLRRYSELNEAARNKGNIHHDVAQAGGKVPSLCYWEANAVKSQRHFTF
jgi:hypothetical protein